MDDNRIFCLTEFSVLWGNESVVITALRKRQSFYSLDFRSLFIINQAKKQPIKFEESKKKPTFFFLLQLWSELNLFWIGPCRRLTTWQRVCLPLCVQLSSSVVSVCSRSTLILMTVSQWILSLIHTGSKTAPRSFYWGYYNGGIFYWTPLNTSLHNSNEVNNQSLSCTYKKTHWSHPPLQQAICVDYVIITVVFLY